MRLSSREIVEGTHSSSRAVGRVEAAAFPHEVDVISFFRSSVAHGRVTIGIVRALIVGWTPRQSLHRRNAFRCRNVGLQSSCLVFPAMHSVRVQRAKGILSGPARGDHHYRSRRHLGADDERVVPGPRDESVDREHADRPGRAAGGDGPRGSLPRFGRHELLHGFTACS